MTVNEIDDDQFKKYIVNSDKSFSNIWIGMSVIVGILIVFIFVIILYAYMHGGQDEQAGISKMNYNGGQRGKKIIISKRGSGQSSNIASAYEGLLSVLPNKYNAIMNSPTIVVNPSLDVSDIPSFPDGKNPATIDLESMTSGPFAAYKNTLIVALCVYAPDVHPSSGVTVIPATVNSNTGITFAGFGCLSFCSGVVANILGEIGGSLAGPREFALVSGDIRGLTTQYKFASEYRASGGSSIVPLIENTDAYTTGCSGNVKFPQFDLKFPMGLCCKGGFLLPPDTPNATLDNSCFAPYVKYDPRQASNEWLYVPQPPSAQWEFGPSENWAPVWLLVKLDTSSPAFAQIKTNGYYMNKTTWNFHDSAGNYVPRLPGTCALTNRSFPPFSGGYEDRGKYLANVHSQASASGMQTLMAQLESSHPNWVNFLPEAASVPSTPVSL